VAVHLATRLNRQRYEPAVISLAGRLGCDLDHILKEAGIEVHYLGKKAGFDYRVYPRLHPILRDCRPDIVHTHLHVLRYALPSLLLLRNVLLLHTVHNLAECEIEPRARWLQRFALNHGVVPVAVGEEVALSVERTYGIKHCRVVLNGIPTQFYACPRMSRTDWRAREHFGEDDVLFVCVARFAPQKNHALLMKAFAQGPASDCKAHLVLVGEGVLREQLEEQAKDLGLALQTHFLGVRTDIPEVLGAMDVFVLSSDWEGNPLSIMEAMASGLPVVSTAAGSVPKLVENGMEGVIVEPGNVQSLADSMVSLLKSRKARQSFGMAAARRAKENFDVSEMVHAYEKLYEDLRSGSPSQKLRSAPRKLLDPAREGISSTARL
jgi:Glycosyltransferase